ncbi:MAG: cytochrome c [Saprospiraceae bacterium]|nr:cytochrome c [Saprospiraceae bacterium]
MNAKIKVIFFFLLGLNILGACNTNIYKQGEWLYNTNCANCHMEDGTGLGTNIPPLAGADYLEVHRNQLACLIRYGVQDTIVVNGQIYHQAMAGHANLTETEITNILNYIHQAWGNALAPISLVEVKEQLKNCQ